MVTDEKLTRRKDSAVDIPASSRDSSKKAARHRGAEMQRARRVVLRPIGYPFRLPNDPKVSDLRIDNQELFADYAREQWGGSVVRNGMYLFDRYVMPDFAFRVVVVEPEESIITRDTEIVVEQSSTLPAPSSKYHLSDIVGHDEVKRKCRLILKYLKDPEFFGEWAPKALLFHGPPGTGKTMTARALATEASAEIIMAKAPDLIGLHVGDGGRRIASLFEEARANAPSIVFVDELDAIGITRSFQSIRGDVSEVVTALISELDRTSETNGVVVIGATNALGLIDPAVRGRFDVLFEFKLPTRQERLEILEMYSSRLPIPLRVDLELVASMTEGLSGRDLRERILKEAFHVAVSRGLPEIPARLVHEIVENVRRRSTPDYTI
ncbi:MAG TPA: AAA family ATPase [Candidatus Thorarchaeota archaeon]|nr:AAA family ATPase [Candidatus Thorarchaeota archaeon]